MRDRERLRAAALHAAATVALAACLPGCTPKVGETAPTETGLYQGGRDTAATASDGADGTDGTDGSGGADGTDGADGADGTTSTDDAPDCREVAPEEWGACCVELGEWCAERYADSSEDYSTCLYGEDFSGTETGCIPWGPPVPPAFSGRRRLPPVA